MRSGSEDTKLKRRAIITKIAVEHQETKPYYIAIAGYECQHENTHIDARDFGRPNQFTGDYEDDWRPVEVCEQCGATRVVYEGEPYQDEDGMIIADDEYGDWEPAEAN